MESILVSLILAFLALLIVSVFRANYKKKIYIEKKSVVPYV